MDSKSTKQRKKLINFFHCFRPAAYEQCSSNNNNNHGDVVSDKADYKYIAVDLLSDGGSNDNAVIRKRSGVGGVLSRALRAVFFETSLVKKMRKMKSKKRKNSMKMRNQSLSSNSSSSSSSNSSAPFSSSSLCSSCSSSSSDTSNRSFRSNKIASNPTSRQRNLGKIKVTESGWFLLLICLLSLILWGKIGGVVFTSAWNLFLIRRSFGIELSEEEKKKKKEIDDSRFYKRRIVMEG